MACPCKNPDGNPCGKFTTFKSNYCYNHVSKAQRDYKKYKRACHAANNIISNTNFSEITDSQVLLKHYALIEKARNLRHNYTEFLWTGYQNSGHAHQLHLLEVAVKNCETRLAVNFSRELQAFSEPLAVDSSDTSSETDIEISPEVLEIPLKIPLKISSLESDKYMDKLIQDNTQLELLNCLNLKPCVRSIYKMFRIVGNFNTWFESPEAFKYFGVVCLLTCNFYNNQTACTLLKIPPLPILPVHLYPDSNNSKATLRSEVAKKMLPSQVNEFVTQIKIYEKQLYQTVSDILPYIRHNNLAGIDIIYLFWNPSTKLYKT